MTIHDAYVKYMRIPKEKLTYEDTKSLREYLGAVKPSDLKNQLEHKKYIELLGHFRHAVLKSTDLMGERFYDTLKNLLAAGADGVYSDKIRFIYELIQNVDDCEYENIEDCNLEIHFERKESNGRESSSTNASITLTYNEKGFLPENVFAITGIAEKYKNMSDKKMEIGEKGIGFKSVFGIANRVIIQSGLFSFSMDSDSFIVPEPYYPENFEKINGTKLIIETTTKEANKIYREFVRAYVNDNSGNAIINKNPILFLNKLTHLKMYQDSFRQIEFSINRNKPTQLGNLYFDSDATIAINFKDSIDTYTSSTKKEIKCVRYTMPVEYGKNECISRYGNDCPFEKRNHNITAVIPVDDNDDIEKGILYSFLPTRIAINTPMVLHVPFKLDSSREYVDPQSENLWFKHTLQQLQIFLKQVYSHFCTISKNKIYKYLPTQKQDFFVRDVGAKIDGLYPEALKGSNFTKEKIFLTTEGTYESCEEVVSLSAEDDFSNAERIHKLLGHPKKLFIPFYKEKLNMTYYGVEVITDSSKKLFHAGLKNSNIFPEIAEMVATSMMTMFQNELERYNEEFVLNEAHLNVISSYPTLYKAFGEYSVNRLRNKKFLCIKLDEKLTSVSTSTKNELKQIVNGTPNNVFMQYLEGIGFFSTGAKIYTIDTDNEDFYFMGKNAIVLPRKSILRGFANMVDPFDKGKIISSTLKIKQVSQILDEPETLELSDEEYIQLLRGVRTALVHTFGQEVYKRFITIVNASSGDKQRFLCELLQNADDCLYDNDVVPALKMDFDGETLTIEYNEQGFTKANVRAITAIGESTKKKILDNDVIGEKGVGFKSVFEVAEDVEIHSKAFNFKLNHNTPTIPEIIQRDDNYNGTKMIFKIKDKGFVLPSKEMVLKLCLCLRKLRNIKIGRYVVEIVDSDNERLVSINNEIYSFEKFEHHFEVTDLRALEERSSGNKRINTRQDVICYRPPKNLANVYYLYSGLPTNIKINIPLIIDVPFELNTSRDNVLQNFWNKYIIKEVYNAIIDVMHKKKQKDRLDVLKYTGFTQGINGYAFKCFSEEFLNLSSWVELLKSQQIIPCLNEGKFVASGVTKCTVVPDVICTLLLGYNRSVKSIYSPGVIVDTLNKDEDENYRSLLQMLGCTIARHDDNLKCIDNNSDIIVKSDVMRNQLYQYLANPKFSNLRNAYQNKNIANLKIYPIRIRNGKNVETQFIQRIGYDIYTHESEVSNEDYQILDTDIMSGELSDRILARDYKIPVLTKAVLIANYKERIQKLIFEPLALKNKAEALLYEFMYRKEYLSECAYNLKGMYEMIPLKMRNGEYRDGNKYINTNGRWFGGNLVDNFIVDDEYVGLAQLIGCKDITQLEFDPDVDSLWLKAVSDDDIEDLLTYQFVRKYDIFCGLIDQEIISDEQIETYNLAIYTGRGTGPGNMNNDGLLPEDFPRDSIKNINNIEDDIRNKFTKPNEYVPVQETKWKASRVIDPKGYLVSCYKSMQHNAMCFCQMCNQRFNTRYFECVEIFPEPDYAWTEMHLHLCSHCAKDFREIRNNKFLREEFEHNLKNADYIDSDVVEVAIPSANESITFTARHFAYIRKILDVEAKSNRMSTRKKIKQQEKAKKK